MRVFVTGASGFLGSYLTAELLEHGHQVGVLLRPGQASWRLKPVIDRVTVVEGALERFAALREGICRFAPEAVMHMAWRGVANGEHNSIDQVSNISDTVQLVSAAAEAGARAFLGAGSQAEYGPYDRPIREDDPVRPTSLYGIAKLSAGLMGQRLCSERRIRFGWFRIFSAYGPRDADHWLIPSLIRTLRSGKHMSLTQCEQLWGFLHVRDASAAFRIALEDATASGFYNLGSPDAPPLHQTVKRLRDLINPSASLGFGEIAYRPDQVMVLAADVSRLAALGWRPTIGLDEGLRDTLNWYDSVGEGRLSSH